MSTAASLDAFAGRPARLTLIAAGLSLVVGAVVMLAKFAAWRTTGSTAILSDALESIINVVAGGFALWTVLLASRPPDERHPYGHGKAEFFSVGFEGALVLIAGLGVIKEGLQQVFDPLPLQSLDLGLLVLVGASAVNGLLGTFLIRMGRRQGSITLAADGQHVLTDVWTSAGVIMGLVLAGLTGWLWVDGAVAALVGLHILFVGWGLGKRAVAGLMNEKDPALLSDIAAVLRQRRQPRWIDVHRLRAWRSGAKTHIDFHLILPGAIPLLEAHGWVKELEEAFQARFGPDTETLIHLDPCEEDECPVCDDGDCADRLAAFQARRDWSVEAMQGYRRKPSDPPAP